MHTLVNHEETAKQRKSKEARSVGRLIFIVAIAVIARSTTLDSVEYRTLDSNVVLLKTMLGQRQLLCLI